MTDRTVLLATSSDWPAGEPGGAALESALAARGIAGRWACWDDESVDWAAADLVVVRSTWDYTGRAAEFLEWARRVERETPLLNGVDVFTWNLDKEYLTRLRSDGQGDLVVVPTVLADDVPGLAAAVTRFGTAVVKPRVGAGGAGVLVVDDPRDPRLGLEGVDHPLLPAARGPWVVQPLVESVRTTGETSVFVIDDVAVSQVDKVPGADEIRVHEHFGGSSAPVALSAEAAAVAVAAVRAAAGLAGRPLDYARVDLLRYDGAWAVSELEVTEPGLYLDVLPDNAGPFADLVASRMA